MNTLFSVLIIVVALAAIGILLVVLQIRDRLDAVAGLLGPGNTKERKVPTGTVRQA